MEFLIIGVRKKDEKDVVEGGWVEIVGIVMNEEMGREEMVLVGGEKGVEDRREVMIEKVRVGGVVLGVGVGEGDELKIVEMLKEDMVEI